MCSDEHGKVIILLMATENELVRFRCDPALKSDAAAVCDRIGFELGDVLRAVVTRIARDGALPLELRMPAPEGAGVPFFKRNEALWKDFRHIDGEVLFESLMHFVATTAARISAEEAKARPNRRSIARWKEQRDEAMHFRRTLNIDDAEAVAKARQRLDVLRAQT